GLLDDAAAGALLFRAGDRAALYGHRTAGRRAQLSRGFRADRPSPIREPPSASCQWCGPGAAAIACAARRWVAGPIREICPGEGDRVLERRRKLLRFQENRGSALGVRQGAYRRHQGDRVQGPGVVLVPDLRREPSQGPSSGFARHSEHVCILARHPLRPDADASGRAYLVLTGYFPNRRRLDQGAPGVWRSVQADGSAVAHRPLQPAAHMELPRLRVHHELLHLAQRSCPEPEGSRRIQAADQGRREPRLDRVPHRAGVPGPGRRYLLLQQQRTPAVQPDAQGCCGPGWNHLARPRWHLAETSSDGTEMRRTLALSATVAVAVLAGQAAVAKDLARIQKGDGLFQYWCAACH